MTTSTLSWAWSRDLKPTHKLVLMAISDGLDWDQEWELSNIERIATRSSIAVWKVKPIIAELIAGGYLRYASESHKLFLGRE